LGATNFFLGKNKTGLGLDHPRKGGRIRGVGTSHRRNSQKNGAWRETGLAELI